MIMSNQNVRSIMKIWCVIQGWRNKIRVHSNRNEISSCLFNWELRSSVHICTYTEVITDALFSMKPVNVSKR